MKILLITGLLAYNDVLELAKSIKNHEISVLKVDKPVASLITLKDLRETLRKHMTKIKSFDLVITPGLLNYDLQPLAKEFNINIIKGTKYCGDIPLMIKALESGITFSTSIPADDVIKKFMKKESNRYIYFLEKNLEEYIEIGNIKIPVRGPPFKVMYEVNINDFNSIKDLISFIQRRSKFFDILILGIRLGQEPRMDLKDVIKEVRKLNKPIGIDSPYIDDVVKGLKASADIAMNIKLSDIENVIKFKDKALVLIPEKTGLERVKELYETYETFRKEGFNKLILDPITYPPLLGLTESIVALWEIRKITKGPILFSLANIYELMDADSPGVVALLMTLASEIGVSVLLVTEESHKARYVLCEVNEMKNLIYRSWLRKSPPLDNGLGLLIIKDKKPVKSPKIKSDEIIKVNGIEGPIEFEANNFFKIVVNKYIHLYNFRKQNGKVMVKEFIGTKGLNLGREIIRKGLIKSLDHALYLGYELAKAEIALQLGKNYIQDEPLFKWVRCYD